MVKLSVHLTMFDIPLIQLCRERLLELLDVALDAPRVGVVLRRVDGFFVAQ